MCGIIGILGHHEVSPQLVEALKRLEYRGYDSAGVATVDASGRLDRRRAVGKLINLSDRLVHEPLTGHAGIGHTRWATHGAATEANAHPHRRGPVAVVTMNRPEYRNAQNSAMTYALDAAFVRAVEDPAIKVIVLAGNGKHFSAGHDIGTPGRDVDQHFENKAVLWWDHVGREAGDQRFARESEVYLGMCRRWREMPKPVIASGGVSSMADLEALKTVEHTGIEGVICGRALYDGRIDPAEALALLSSPLKNERDAAGEEA